MHIYSLQLKREFIEYILCVTVYYTSLKTQEWQLYLKCQPIYQFQQVIELDIRWIPSYFYFYTHGTTRWNVPEATELFNKYSWY